MTIGADAGGFADAILDTFDELALLFVREGSELRCVTANAAWHTATGMTVDGRGDPPEALLPVDAAARLHEAAGRTAPTRYDDVLAVGAVRRELDVTVRAFEHLGLSYVLWRALDVTGRRSSREATARVRRDLERSNADLAAFATVASHDLQEPLRMVSAFVELLARRYRGQLDDTADTYIGFALDGAQRMRTLIDALLDYALLQASPSSAARVDLVDVVGSTIEGLRPTIEAAGAVVTVGPLTAIDGDSAELARLVHNLVTNALKFRGAEPVIHIGLEPSEDGVALVVEDNGVGIPDDRLEDVFDMFTRLHPRGAYPGSGIGLALCRSIVERHDGRLWAEHSPSGGARFVAAFPSSTCQETT